MKTDLNFKLASYRRNRFYEAYKVRNVGKTNKTFDLLKCSQAFSRRRIFLQLYDDMSIDNNGSVWCIDHCLPIEIFNLLEEKAMKNCFIWINLRPMYTKENNSKRAKIDNRLYLMQETKAYQFLNLNEEELNKDLH